MSIHLSLLPTLRLEVFLFSEDKATAAMPLIVVDTVLFDLPCPDKEATNVWECVSVSWEQQCRTSSWYLPFWVWRNGDPSCLSIPPSCSPTEEYESFSYSLLAFTPSCGDYCCKLRGRSAPAHFSSCWFYHLCRPPRLLIHPFHLCHFSHRQLFPKEKKKLTHKY